ncbi:twin-arginine translocation signal domain-containing protein [Halapricum hydrolyticum]|uniref:Twin-arginine translocation signal domain-containing protein n=1 Tax=Halapricum hydrolyticum TaxID=2979991 RepID=A0AAE3I954_9EURY|nr:twin-arginine translocation signal domain-containing protein [Halapricum hydrolyticum]MCU4717236.1 twin-arginine translocation signal domain-containing protein [Halapricum hydrolyticum]MCU4726163.1 twin-arginine translocation signal domain-containing protein [Halapricum hydrolyticum]
MVPTRRQFLGTATLTAALAGCLGGDGNGSNPTTDEDVTVSVRSVDTHGDILVGPDGMTLYMFVPDADADGSTCYDSCAATWPPLTVDESPSAADSVTASLSTITRDDGSMQVLAGEWPLYYYAGDDSPGDVNGQGVNDAWYVLGPDGTPKGMETTTETTTETATETTTETTVATSPTIEVRDHDTLGEILVGPDGMTVYMFESDTAGADESSCTGGCVSTWPPVTVEGDPSAGDDVTATLATFEREDGSTQVSADGWPLYYYAGDDSPGDANGQGASGVWYVLRPDGSPLREPPTTDDGSGGIGY